MFTWGETQRECYLNTLTMIDQLGQFIERTGSARPQRFGGEGAAREDRDELHAIMPSCGRGLPQQRWIGTFSDATHVLEFVNSEYAQKLAHLGTSCPDHFIRTKIRPLFIRVGSSGEDLRQLKRAIDTALAVYRKSSRVLQRAAEGFACDARCSPTVVLVPGLGMFSFGKNKTESRITGEFYINAIHVMEGAGGWARCSARHSAVRARQCSRESVHGVHATTLRCRRSEAFRIEYWALEEAKIRRQPAGEGIEPAGGCCRRRSQRYRARGCVAGGRARGPRCHR